jgi:enoyl-CoA hydratase
VGLGIIAGFGGTQRLPRLVGEANAKWLLFSGERITAQRALEIGLVNAVVSAESLMDKALEMAAAIAKNAPIGVRATKRAMNSGREKGLDAALNIEAACFGTCFESEDQKEAMSAMLEKRKAAPFVGR